MMQYKKEKVRLTQSSYIQFMLPYQKKVRTKEVYGSGPFIQQSNGFAKVIATI